MYSKYHSLNLSFVNATVVAFPEFLCDDDSTNDDFRGRAYLTVLDDRSRDPSCGKIPENNLDHNNRKRLRIYRKEEILYVLIAKLGTVPGLSYFQYLGEDIKIRSITCEFPRGMDYDGFLPYMVPSPGVVIHLNGTLDKNMWIETMSSNTYKALLWYSIPSLYLINTIVSLVFIALKLLSLRRNGMLSISGIVDHKGRRSSVVLTLLSLEIVTSSCLAYVYNRGGYYSRPAKPNLMAFAATGFVNTSLGTTILAGVFWFDRRQALERRANFQNSSDERAFFIRFRKPLTIAAVILLFLDIVCGVFIMMRLPNFETIIAGTLFLLSPFCGFLVSTGSQKFNSLVKAIRKNMNYSQHRSLNVHNSLRRMMRIFRWFVLSAIMILGYSAVMVCVVLIGPKLYVPSSWLCYWSASNFFRWAISFSQIMMCFPDKQNIRKRVTASGQDSTAGTSSAPATRENPTVLSSG